MEFLTGGGKLDSHSVSTLHQALCCAKHWLPLRLFTGKLLRKLLLLPRCWIECENGSYTNRVELSFGSTVPWSKIACNFFMKWDFAVSPKGSEWQKGSIRIPTVAFTKFFLEPAQIRERIKKSFSSCLGSSCYKHASNTKIWLGWQHMGCFQPNMSKLDLDS